MAKNERVSSWNLVGLRLTAFPIIPADYPTLNWWAELVGEKPEKRTESPREGMLVEQGSFSDGNLSIRLLPHRIDLNLNPLSEGPIPSESLPSFGVFPEDSEEFCQLVKKWFQLTSCPELQRLAFGSIVLKPVDSQQQGYETLGKYLPSVDLDPIGSSDFFYQINRARDSSKVISGLKINRLSKWSVLRWESGVISSERTIMIPSTKQFACRLELDINTAANFDGKLDKPLDLYQELVDLAVEVSTKGDIK